MKTKQFFLFLVCIIFLQSTNKAQTIIKTKKPGTLEQILSQEQKDTCSFIVIEGKINSADIKVLRQMAGYPEDGSNTGKLFAIDLRKAKFVTDENPFMILNTKNEKIAGTALPSKIKWWVSSYANGPIDGKLISLTASMGGTAQYKTLGYMPFFFIDYDKEYAVKISRYIMCNVNRGWGPTEIRESVGDFRFKDGITETQWKEMKDYEVNKFIGHKIINKDGVFFMEVSLKKGKFTHDTFYKCPNLRYVFLPKDIVCVPYIFDYHSQIMYFVGNKPYVWAYDMRLKPMEWERPNALTKELAEKYWYGY